MSLAQLTQDLRLERITYVNAIEQIKQLRKITRSQEADIEEILDSLMRGSINAKEANLLISHVWGE